MSSGGPINSIFYSVTERLSQWTNNGDPTALPYADAADWCMIGAANLPSANVPPRIVWIPTTEGSGPPQGQGGDGISSPRPVGTRYSNIDIHIWAAADPQTGQAAQNAADLEAAEALINAFRWACYSRTHGSPPIQTGQARWASLNVDGSNLVCGIGYVLTITVNIPVVRPLETTALIGEIPVTLRIPTDPTVIDIKEDT